MGIYSEIFTATDAIKHEVFTILVESVDPKDGKTGVVIEALEGEYKTREEFMDVRKDIIDGWKKASTREELMLYSSMTMMLPGARQLVEKLNEALSAS